MGARKTNLLLLPISLCLHTLPQSSLSFLLNTHHPLGRWSAFPLPSLPTSSCGDSSVFNRSQGDSHCSKTGTTPDIAWSSPTSSHTHRCKKEEPDFHVYLSQATLFNALQRTSASFSFLSHRIPPFTTPLRASSFIEVCWIPLLLSVSVLESLPNHPSCFFNAIIRHQRRIAVAVQYPLLFSKFPCFTDTLAPDDATLLLCPRPLTMLACGFLCTCPLTARDAISLNLSLRYPLGRRELRRFWMVSTSEWWCMISLLTRRTLTTTRMAPSLSCGACDHPNNDMLPQAAALSGVAWVSYPSRVIGTESDGEASEP